jgi:hypothetical protein
MRTRKASTKERIVCTTRSGIKKRHRLKSGAGIAMRAYYKTKPNI